MKNVCKQSHIRVSNDAGCITKNQLKMVYLDVWGPMQVDVIGGNRYFVTFIDNLSIKLCTYQIKRKDEVFEVFKKFNSMVDRQSSRKLKVFKMDGGGEYVSKDFERFCDEKRDVYEVVTPYTRK